VKALVFAKVLVRAPQVRSFEVAAAPVSGWEVSERAGDAVVQQRHYSDWHRVERVLTRFRREISELQRQGWIES
jgi:hypothetical protein